MPHRARVSLATCLALENFFTEILIMRVRDRLSELHWLPAAPTVRRLSNGAGLRRVRKVQPFGPFFRQPVIGARLVGEGIFQRRLGGFRRHPLELESMLQVPRDHLHVKSASTE